MRSSSGGSGQDTVAEERLGIDPGSPFWGDHCSRYHFASSFCRGRVVLDIACGTGFGGAILAKEGARGVLGVDMSPDALVQAAAHEVPHTGWVRADGSNLPLPDGALAAVTSFETIEHLHEPDRFLAELRRVLEPHGVLVISTPNALYTKPVNGKPANPFHVREFTPSEFHDMLGRHFGEIRLLGQAPDDRYKACPYWILPEHLPTDLGGRLEALAWKVESRLPHRARDTLSRVVHRRALYPGEHDFVFSEAAVRTGHVLVAVARP